GLTEGERGFEQTKECYLTEVIPFFKTLKEHFEGTQKALTKEIKEMKNIFEELDAEVDQNVVNRKHDEIERKNLLIANDNLIVDCFSKEVFYIAKNYELTLKYQNLKESFGNDPSQPARNTPDFDSVFVIKKIKASIQGKDNAIKKLSMQISQLKETRSEAYRTLDFRTLDFQITQLTEKVTITCAKHIEQTTALLTENENLKAQIHENLKCDTMESVKPRVLAPGVNCCTNASGSHPRSNTKKNKISAAKGVNKKKVEERPRTNKSNLRTTNCVDSSSSSKRTLINSNSDFICQTCNKCLISVNHDVCVVDYLQSIKASPSVHNIHNVVRKVKQV
ncbi:hypothetical protein Tco_0884615, partial [Tanacetum coccineum]